MSILGIVITTDNDISVREFTVPLYKSASAVIGGWVEHVRPRGLPSPYCMYVDEEGLLKGLPMNPIASQLYQTYIHGCAIKGTAIMFKDILTDDGEDTVGLTDDDIAYLMPLLEKLKPFI